ncbi:arginase, hepatic [Neocloeon triangulifer]|uniref:arginase, hepatic n=1 Tax=Neocloeon triangulifer TaxID=2078957 RepID=UPI00286F5A53|nr:arginase, hepatic [Neocloeon triangulifer]
MNSLRRTLLHRPAKKIFARLFASNNNSNARVGIVGVPFEKGQRNSGVSRGPGVLRAGGIVQDLLSFGCDVKDYGDVDYKVEQPGTQVNNMLEYDDFASCMEKVSSTVKQVLSEGRLCLSLGGDHSMGVGTIDGHYQAKGDLAVLWVDAHADINTNATSPTGNLHGMPVALLVKELADYWPYLPGMDWQMPKLSIKNIAYIGLRSVDEYESLILEKFGVTAFSMEDVEQYGVHEVTRRALEAINPHGDRSLHVSFDIDSLDPIEAPSTGTAERGGLSLREGVHIMETVFASGTLGAMDLVEVNPGIGSERDVKITVEAARQVVRAGFGYKRRGMRPLLAQEIPGLIVKNSSQSEIN